MRYPDENGAIPKTPSMDLLLFTLHPADRLIPMDTVHCSELVIPDDVSLFYGLDDEPQIAGKASGGTSGQYVSGAKQT